MYKKTMVLASSLLAIGLLFAAAPSTQAATKSASKATVTKKITKSVPKKIAKKPVVKRRSVSAIKGADEKEIANPQSRCLTPAMKALHDKAVKQMEADIAKLGAGHDEAVKIYKNNIAIIWSAMSEPYCGFGKGTINTVAKGFEKSVARSREKFLAATRK